MADKERVTNDYIIEVSKNMFPHAGAVDGDRLISAEDVAESFAAQENQTVTINKADSLGDRMKGYENAYRNVLPAKMPVILRVDGRAFHTYTRGTKTPFDENLMEAMNQVAIKLCESISGAQLAYVQSDEISVFLSDYTFEGTQAWFGGNIQKMVSISAALASVEMTLRSPAVFTPPGPEFVLEPKDHPATFDSRVFILPKEDVVNYFVWRQQDWTRNSLQMLARSLYSHKQLENKNSADLHELCFQKGHNWNDLATEFKRGRCIVKKDREVAITAGPQAGTTIIRPKWTVDREIPIFSKDRNYIGVLV